MLFAELECRETNVNTCRPVLPLAGDTEIGWLGLPPAWFTVNGCPPMVRIARRAEVPTFAVKVKVKDADPTPLVGVTESQPAFEFAVQEASPGMVDKLTLPVPAEDATLAELLPRV